jgi:regulatory protein
MTDNDLIKVSLNKAMALCASREYCVSEIRSKLGTWGVEEADCNRLIEKLKKDRFIDEERYALSFVRDKFRYNKWGKLKLAAHLRAKKIPDEIIRTALDDIDIDSYRSMLEGLLSSHRKTIKAKNQYDLKGKLMRYGLAKGFESTLLYEILGDLESYSQGQVGGG